MFRPVIIDPVSARAAQRKLCELPEYTHEVVARGGRYECESCDFVAHSLTRVAAHVVSTQFRVK
jgi:hypothetical protein